MQCLFQSLKTVTAQLQQPLIPQNAQVTLKISNSGGKYLENLLFFSGPRSKKEIVMLSQHQRKFSDFDMELPPLEVQN